MMLARDLLSMSLHNLLLHKVRSMLTSLGVIFGVGSVIAMLAISEGAKRSALAQIEAMGIDKILVFTKHPTAAGTSPNASESMVERFGLTEVDARHLERLQNVAEVTKAVDSRRDVLRGLTRTDLKLIGCDRSFLENSTGKLTQGRWFSVSDFKNKRNVCVIGRNVKRRLFPLGSTGVVGRNLRVSNYVFKIIGIVENDYSTEYPELGTMNDFIMIPLPTSRANFGIQSVQSGGQSRITNVAYDLFMIRVEDIRFIDNTAKRVAGYMSLRHSDVKDWGIVVPLDLLKQREATQNIFTIVMGSIAGISLIVGGIGIMNIMLASVYERRKEIGTRRALGAQKGDVLCQFLIETVTLTTIGGALGVLLGVGIGTMITFYSGMPTVYSMWSIVLSMAISCVVGVIFGTYPAWQAAQQNPINVLRAE